MEIFGYLAALAMGLVLGLIGGGGSILTVPILVYLFKLPPVLATGYSLFIVGLTALVGAWQYSRESLVQFKVGVIFAVPSFVGVYLSRAYVVPNLPDPIWQSGTIELSKASLLMGAFAILMLLASVSMIQPKNSDLKKLSPKNSELEKSDQKDRNSKYLETKNADNSEKLGAVGLNGFRVALIALEGLTVGGFTGFVGAGGGFLIIPALVILVGLSMRQAVGTSLAIIAVKSLLGFLGDIQVQPELDYFFLLGVSVTSMVGMLFGLRVKSFFSEAFLKKAFGYFVLFMGTVIFLDQIL